MAGLAERIETSIFRDDTEKSIVSAIMNPRVRGGFGEIMLGIARDITKEMWNFRYTGRCLADAGRESTMSKEQVSVKLDTCFRVFGGCAYLLHAEKDKSRFAHILPGLHDVDIQASVVMKYEPRLPDLINPFDETSIRYHMENGTFHINEEGVLPYVMRKTLSIILRRLERSRPPKYYYRRTAGGTDEVEIVQASLNPNFLYQTVVNDIYLVGIMWDGSSVRIQIEVGGKLKDIVGVDHVFEIIFDTDTVEAKCTGMERVGGVFVDNIKNLFRQNMDSAISRSHRGSDSLWMEDRHHFFGKCALDVLRLTYVILTELEKESSWINQRTYDVVDLRTYDDIVTDITSGRIPALYHRQTPIEYFTQYMKYLAPCIERSGIGRFHLQDEDLVRFERNFGAPVFLKEILEIFVDFTEGNKRLQLDTLSDRVRDIGLAQNLATGRRLPLKEWPPHLKQLKEGERTRVDRRRRKYEEMAEKWRKAMRQNVLQG